MEHFDGNWVLFTPLRKHFQGNQRQILFPPRLAPRWSISRSEIQASFAN